MSCECEIRICILITDPALLLKYINLVIVIYYAGILVYI